MAALEALSALTQQLTPGVAGVAGTSGPGTALVGPVGTAGTAGTAGPGGGGFAATLVSSLEQVQQLHATSSGLAVQAATGDLTDVHDYTIASTQAKVATEVTVAVRNKALEAFNEIMRMQV